MYKYAFQGYDKERMVRVCRTGVPISLKKSVEIARTIKGKRAAAAIEYLEQVMEKKKAVPYKRYVQEMPHRKGKGIATGGYPIKAAEEFRNLVKLALSCAQERELGEDLVLLSVSVRKGIRRYRQGRHSGRMKNSHIEMILAVAPKQKKKKVVNKK